MSALKFINELPMNLRHQEGYRRVIEASRAGQNPVLDLAAWEKACVGIGEGNLLRDLAMPEKFTLKGMDVSLPIRSQSLAKQKDKVVGKGTLTGERVYNETFSAKENILLIPHGEFVDNCSRPGVQLPNNHPMYKSVLSSLTGIANHYLTSTSISFLGEKLTVRQDLRHLFLKGYLMVMSYNLATVSDVKKLKFNNLNAKVCYNVTPKDKMHLLVSKKIVVDASMFSPTELWILAEMGGKYPNRRYGDRNIYNSIFMEADDLFFFTTKGEDSLICNASMGSPERMWCSLLNIAIKMDALDDLKMVISEFRGLPGILSRVRDWTDKYDFRLEYPLSYSVLLALDGAVEKKPTIQKHSNYFSTSKCLVADLLLSRMMEMSLFNVIEESGALGSIGCPTGAPSADPFLDGTFRQLGLRLDAEGDNIVLDEWKGITSADTPVMFAGKLRHMGLMMASAIKRGESDFLRPQLLHALPYSRCKNTTWACVRGWRFQSFNFEDDRDKRLRDNLLTRGYTWVMGVSDQVPRVGLNAAGDKLMDNLSLEEMKFLSCASGEYSIGLVRHILDVEVQPRTDEMELDSDCFYMSNYPGSRCTIAYDSSGLPKNVIDSRSSVNDVRDTLGVSRRGVPNRGAPPNLRLASFGGGNVSLRLEPSGAQDPALLLGPSDGGDTDGVPSAGANRRGDQRYHGRPNGRGRTSGHSGRGAGSGGRDGGRGRAQDYRAPNRGDTLPGRVAGTVTDGARRHGTGESLPAVLDSNPELEGQTAGTNDASGVLDEALLISPGALKLVMNPPRVVVDGVPRGVTARTVRGEEVEIVAGLQKDLVNENALRGYLLETVGDGRCGVHAILQDLRVRRMIDAEDVNAALTDILSKLVSTRDHNYQELAAVCNNLNMGLVVIGEESKRLLNYGDVGAHHIMYIKHSDARSHYETFIPDTDGDEVFDGYTYFEEHVTPGELAVAWRTIFPILRSEEIEAERARQVSLNANGSRNRWRSDGAV